MDRNVAIKIISAHVIENFDHKWDFLMCMSPCLAHSMDSFKKGSITQKSTDSRNNIFLLPVSTVVLSNIFVSLQTLKEALASPTSFPLRSPMHTPRTPKTPVSNLAAGAGSDKVGRPPSVISMTSVEEPKLQQPFSVGTRPPQTPASVSAGQQPPSNSAPSQVLSYSNWKIYPDSFLMIIQFKSLDTWTIFISKRSVTV